MTRGKVETEEHQDKIYTCTECSKMMLSADLGKKRRCQILEISTKVKHVTERQETE